MREPGQRDEIRLELAGFGELIGLRNARPLEQLLLHRFTDAERVHRARRGYATRRWKSAEGRQFFARNMHLERLSASCEFSTRSPQHEPAYGMDEAEFEREAVLAKSARAKAVSRTKQLK